MAFYQDEEDKQDPNTQGAAQQGPTGSGIITGTEGSGTSGAQSAPSSAPTAAPDKPGNFVGLKDYLNANRVQSQKLGDQVAGNLNQNTSEASQALGGAQGAFDQKVKGGQIAGFEGAQEEGKGLINNAATQGKTSAQDAARFGEITNAQYKGPNTLAEAADVYQPLSDKVNKANTQAGLTNTEEGKQTLLRGMNQSPNYTQGSQRFDSYLLNDPNNRSKLEQARTGAGALQGQLTEQEQMAAQKAQSAQAQAKATADAVRSAFGRFDDPSTPENEAAGATGDYQKTIQKQLQDAQTYGQGLTSRVNSGGLTTDDLQKMGLQNLPTYGVDFKNYYQENNPTDAGVTTPEEKAKYDALSQLGGLQGGMYNGAGAGDFGNYSPGANKDAFNQAVGAQRDLYEKTNPLQRAQALAQRFNAAPGEGYYGRYKSAVGSAKNADDVQAALQALESEQTAHGVDPNFYSEEGDLRNYLSDTLPGMRSQLLSKQEAPPVLPVSGTGIDWSQIQAPTGGASKYQDPTNPEDDFLRKG